MNSYFWTNQSPQKLTSLSVKYIIALKLKGDYDRDKISQLTMRKKAVKDISNAGCSSVPL